MPRGLEYDPGPLTPADPAGVAIAPSGPIFSPLVAEHYGLIRPAAGAMDLAREDIAQGGATTTIDAVHEQVLGPAAGDLAATITGISDADPSDVLGVAGDANGAMTSAGDQYTVPPPPEQPVPNPGPPPDQSSGPPGSSPDNSI